MMLDCATLSCWKPGKLNRFVTPLAWLVSELTVPPAALQYKFNRITDYSFQKLCTMV